MAYITVTELLDYIDLEALKSLSNDIDPTTINTARVERIIDNVSDKIDDILRQVYDVPLTNPSGSIKQYCADIVIYYLYKKRSSTPDDVANANEEAIKRLEDLRDTKLAQLAQGTKDEDYLDVLTFDNEDITEAAFTPKRILSEGTATSIDEEY